MNDVNQFANIDEAAESVDASSDTEMDCRADVQPSAEADIVADAEPVELLPEIRIMQLEAELTAQRAKLDELALNAVEQHTDLKKRLRDAEIRAELAEQKHGDAGRELFERGRKISALEREVDNLTRSRDAAEIRANAHVVEADSVKSQMQVLITDNETLRRANESLERRLADGAPGIEYDIIESATAKDLRAAEMTGWSVKHMQFSESGTLRVVLRRNKSQQPHDRKPATASRAIPTRPIVPPLPARPMPTTQAEHIDGTGEMVIVGLVTHQSECR